MMGNFAKLIDSHNAKHLKKIKSASGNKIMKASKLDGVLQMSLLLHHDFHVVTLFHRHTYLPSTSMKGKNNVAVIEIRIRTHFEEFDLNIFLSPPRLYRLHRSRCWFCVMWHHSVFDWSLSLYLIASLVRLKVTS